MRTDPAFEAWMQKARVPIEREVARRGIKLKRQGNNELIGPCPKCGGDDRFSINIKKQLFNCRGCDVGGDVIDLVRHLDDLSLPDAGEMLSGEPMPKANGKAPPQAKANAEADHAKPKKIVAARFDYIDEAGALLFQVERVELQNADGSFVLEKNGKAKKTFRQRQPDPERPGEWLWNVEGVRVVPYRLPELHEAISNEHAIFICEGERKVDLLQSWNVPATCNAGGSRKWSSAHATFLRGADVVILPDNDVPGRQHVDTVAASLQGVAARVRVVELPGLREKEDIVEWAQAHTREELDDLVEAAADWAPAMKNDAPARKPKLTVLSSAEFVRGFLPPDYLLDGILQRRFVYSFTGKTGSGKTAVLTFLAASTELGRAIGPHAVEKGSVLYFAGENPDDVRMRWIALSQQMDFDVNQVDVHFIPGVFKISELMDEIKTEVAARGGVNLIIVDTSAAYFEGDDENANKPAGDHARRFRELTTLDGGPCVVVACHPPKTLPTTTCNRAAAARSSPKLTAT